MIAFCPSCRQGHIAEAGAPIPRCVNCERLARLRAISAIEGVSVIDGLNTVGVPYWWVLIECQTVDGLLNMHSLHRLLTGPDGPALLGRQPWGAEHRERLLANETVLLRDGRAPRRLAFVRGQDDFGDVFYACLPPERPSAEHPDYLWSATDRTDIVACWCFDTELAWVADVTELHDDVLRESLWSDDPFYPHKET